MTAPLEGKDLSRYHAFSLGISLEAVVAASCARADEARVLHARPVTINELEWRTIYSRRLGEEYDAVRGVVFTFYDDQLYQVVATYDPERTAGLTNDDLVDAVSVAYGPPVERARGRNPSRTSAPWCSESDDTTVVSCWESPEEAATLLRSKYSQEVSLILVSKRLSLFARSAAREAVRLDALEGPQRQKAESARIAAETQAAHQKARAANKPTFRP